MNSYQISLWHDLMRLVNDSEAFYFSDQEMDGQIFRIFNYRLASYTEFIRPSGLECRGHMFEITEEGEPLRLAALPPEKFFNLNECPLTMGLDLTSVNLIENKVDGSLISSYHTHAGPRLKSKGSLASDQAVDAMKWLAGEPIFQQDIATLSVNGMTVNTEWVAPHNRIVIGYDKPELIVLNVRDTKTGNYVSRDYLMRLGYTEVYARWTERLPVEDPVIFVSLIPDMTGIEGYVVRLESEQRVKIKTQWYLALHRTKDNINSPRRLFEACLEEATDDMRSLFFDDPVALRTISEMEEFAAQRYNHMVDTVERFYERNKHLDRKSYAILGQEELKDTMFFGLAMNKYVGKETNYKEFLKGKWKQLGLKDLEKDDE